MSAISRKMGAAPVDPAFRQYLGTREMGHPLAGERRPQGLAGVQLFAGRMRRDAADALAYGCTGLMGLQWRTDILGPNVAALAEAAWTQAGWNPTLGKTRAMPVPSTEGALGGMIADFSGQKIKGTADATLYQTCRYGLEGYNMKIPNGRYRVTLNSASLTLIKPGSRIGDFKLQGKPVIESLDIFARVGKNAALDIPCDNIEVTDGWLRLEVAARQSLP